MTTCCFLLIYKCIVLKYIEEHVLDKEHLELDDSTLNQLIAWDWIVAAPSVYTRLSVIAWAGWSNFEHGWFNGCWRCSGFIW